MKGGHRYGQFSSRLSPHPPTEVLDLTSLTVAEFQRSAPPFEAAFQAPSASSSGLVGHDQMRLARTAIIGIHPCFQFVRAEEPVRFRHGPLPMNPLGFNGVEPRTFAGQRPNDEAHADGAPFDLLMVLTHPVSQGMATGPDAWSQIHSEAVGKPRTAQRDTTYKCCPPAHSGGAAVVDPRLPVDLCAPSHAGAAVWDGSEQSPSVDSYPLGGAAGDAARVRGYPTTRSVTELAKRLGYAEADAAAIVEPAEGSAPTSALPAAAALPGSG
jgi:hypothetical protein